MAGRKTRHLSFTGRRRQEVRQRSAKPPPPVQIRAAPPLFISLGGSPLDFPARCALGRLAHAKAFWPQSLQCASFFAARPRQMNNPLITMTPSAMLDSDITT